MAMMFPNKNVNFTNDTEAYVYNYLKENLPDKCRCYYNYYVGKLEADFIVMIPQEGMIIIEVKGWEGRLITNIENNNTISYKYKGSINKVGSPWKQCRGYCFKLKELIKERTNLDIYVSPIVCYPDMQEIIFKEKGLHVISDRSVTLLKEDLSDSKNFFKVLREKARHNNQLKMSKLTEDNIIAIRGALFETYEQIEDQLTVYERRMLVATNRDCYSILAYLPENIEEMTIYEKVHQYAKRWRQGTKIILLTGYKDIEKVINKAIQEAFKDDGSYLEYVKKKGLLAEHIFNWEIYYMEPCEQCVDFEVYDGMYNEDQLKVLQSYDKKSKFNIKQYQAEHVDYKKDILIKAGAGTGKTHSMIFRIAYLIYKNKFKPNEIVKSIYMITFTNEAAENMKRRLKSYFSNMFILSQDVYYLSIMENIAQMNISTIHSLVKKIIEKYSTYIGIGHSIDIESGVYQRREAIAHAIEKYIEDHQDTILEIVSEYEKYEIVKTVEQFMHKIESKNIDLAGTFDMGEVAQGEKEKQLFQLILYVAKKVQAELIENDFENNTIQLGNLILYLNKIVEYLEVSTDQDHELKYLFIDEFQDTDNFQIDLIKKFRNIFKFNLFVVGDIKQCIYRFRGAEDNAFVRLLNQEIKENWINISLNKNYRSLNELLRVFNKYFMRWGQEELLNYSLDDELVGINEIEGKSQVKQITYQSKEEFIEQFVAFIQEKRDALKDTENIAILTRNNKEITQIREICKNAGIELKTDVTENLYTLESTIELYKLILALQFPNNPKYLYNLTTTSYSRGISNKMIYKYKDQPEHWVEVFNREADNIIPKWSNYIEQLKNEPVIRVIKQIITDVKPWNNYARRVSKEEDNIIYNRKLYKRNLDCLLEDVIQKSNQDYITINKLKDFLYIMIFAKQYEQRREANEQKDNKDRIVCTTIHKSKGLEYTHVILPYALFELEKIMGNEILIEDCQIGIQLKIGNTKIVNTIFENQKETELNSKIKEELRILYVAMTRAEETFTWFSDEQPSEANEKIKVTWQKFLKEVYDENNHLY